MATHSSILAWKTPSTEEPGRLYSMGSQKVELGHYRTEHARAPTHTHTHTHNNSKSQGLSYFCFLITSISYHSLLVETIFSALQFIF